MLTSLSSRITEERRKSEPYTEMFEASEHGMRKVLSVAHGKIQRTLLDLHQVMKDIGIEEGKENELWDALHLLPFLYRSARKDIGENEGMCCEADKTREILAKWYTEQFIKKDMHPVMSQESSDD